MNVSSDESARDPSLTPRPPAAGLYSAINRNRNRTRIESFAQNADPASSSRREGFIFQFGGGGGMYDMTTMWDGLNADDSAPYVGADSRQCQSAQTSNPELSFGST